MKNLKLTNYAPYLFVLYVLLIFAFVFIPTINVKAYEVPILQVTSPQNNAKYDKINMGFNGKVINQGTAISSLKLLVYFDSSSTGEIVDIATETWSFSKKLSDGSHIVRFELKDGDTLVDEETINFFIIGVHGNYSDNTQSCANCHNTHTGSNQRLLGGYSKEKSTTNLCMACHDGTSAVRIETFKSPNIDQKLGGGTSTCSSCHDPHLDRTPENPYRLKDIDCETCSQDGINVSHYRAITYSIGDKSVTDYSSFCLKCHDDDNNINIKQYLTIPSTEPQSMHKLTIVEGEELAGNIPCAECHDTHNSKNVKQLREQLGHINPKSFSATEGEWGSFERVFCLKCHHNELNRTTIYGLEANPLDPERVGHEEESNQPCSSCHSTSYNSENPLEGFREAAHAPKKMPTQTTSP
jgi:predicted CXXCH cytochrome family protein